MPGYCDIALMVDGAPFFARFRHDCAWELSSQQLGELVANGYGNYETKMSKDSPSIEYVVKVRHNEGKEHAFLCWLTESLLSGKGMKPKMASIYGPDIEVELNGKKMCFEIETGTWLKYMDIESRFAEKKRSYDEVYLVVPNERVGRTYQALCTKIITKAELEGFIDRLAWCSTTFPMPGTPVSLCLGLQDA